MKKAIILVMCLIVTAMAVGQEPPKKKKGNNNEAETLFDYTKEVISSDARFNFVVICNPEVSEEDTANCLLSRAIGEIQKMREIAVVIVVGNITRDGKPEQMMIAKTMLKKMGIEYFVVPGNKDLSWKENGGTDFKRIFENDKFRTNINGVMFVGLNTSLMTDTAERHFLPQDAVWLKNQLKSIGKKTPIIALTANGFGEGGVDNWREITDQLRMYNTQLCVNAAENRFGRTEYDQVCGYSMETLDRSYMVGYVRGSEMYINRKELGKSLRIVDTVVIEAKMYLEPEKKKKTVEGEKPAWVFNAGYAIYTGAEVSGEYCYFGDDYGMFYCLDLKKGKVKWKYRTILRIVTRPVVVEGRVLFGSCDRNLYCLNAETGEFLWKIRTDAPVTRQPKVEGKSVYLEMNDSMQFVVNIETGEEERPRESRERLPFDDGQRRTDIGEGCYVVTTIDGVVMRFGKGKK